MLGVSERGNKEVWVDNQCIVLIVIDVGTIIACTTLPIGRQHSALELDKTVSVMASFVKLVLLNCTHKRHPRLNLRWSHSLHSVWYLEASS